MRKQLRRFHKESNNYDVYFKSQAYWKSFYKGLINHCGDMMDCFRFDDLRDVQKIVESHDLPDELLSFVTQQLMEWRELFKDVEWLKRFRETSKKVEAYQQKCQEQADRLMVLNEIGLEFDPLSQTESDNESDDDGSSDSENSSLRNGAANSNADDAADISSDEAENDNDFDAFFND
ncbi:hypothetical protein L5515_004607 [Caenorhabditis briggsae]|uniref:Uncharacterized protein n=1 Tax=Caenorhabditis briggsae TaxID=6238 RepID=A0AAE9JC56_CAEBR|nr:hypothetical protein L5515_004607 [Caenorhabditis briggsae]